ncbi:pentatricopeptide repeat-containing protein At4g02750-like [Selaginella moellendorffii]|uniref:pentatricopeptide repeat-containing protein At4g02750-like n=1 Tax=Selaginella moellendorffii TaxID=88036 RepID=UPI000D1CCCAD|nr:pentatricopeptide repeat-containing protein At4g02750-like [Selaginella moellendorffii]|eukprot:XP_024543642.1 pentatricopeptide repeat-containing protein At4g02750-like [Selaginella moellendorffii]
MKRHLRWRPWSALAARHLHRTPGGSSCLKRMVGELQEGEWAIWGDLARRRLIERKSPEISSQQQQQDQRNLIDILSYAEHIRRCAFIHLLPQGRRLYWELRIAGMDQHRYLGNLLIQMFGNCRSVVEAKAVFDGIRERNLYSWNIMLVAYAQNGHLREARMVFEKMPLPSVVTWNAIHGAYAQAGEFFETVDLFARIPDRDPVSWNTMITVYAQHGHLDESKATFEAMPTRNVVSWNSIAVAYVRSFQIRDARLCFDRMPCHNVVSWNTIVSGYVELGEMAEAKELFQNMPERDAVSWTALITGLAQERDLDRAREMFERMPLKDLVSWTAMITAFSHNGRLQEAQSLLDSLGTFDSGSWNAMITGYIQNGEGRAALQLFRLMDLEGVGIDKVGFFNALDAAISIANLAEGRAVHTIARDSGFLLNLQVNNSLINMYGKCGSLENARDVAVEMFQLMILAGVQPDEIAFTTTLSGCSHGGLFRTGWEIFSSIQDEFGGIPSMDHYACMVDLLGRVGHLERAEELIQCMPYEPQLLTWRSLVAACKLHGDAKRGKRLARFVMMLDEGISSTLEIASSTYVLVYNMFSSAGEDAELVDGVKRRKRANKF